MPAGAIRIRMYRIGFGDCFLVTLPVTQGDGAAERHILFDCGVHFLGVIDNSLVGQIVDNIGAVTGKRLDVIVATHAHQDHVSGFADCADSFRSFSIGQVWLPWTENPNDPQARRLSEKQQRLAEQLAAHLDALLAVSPGDTGLDAARLAVLNLAGAAEAMPLLRSGFSVTDRVRYYEAGKSLNRVAGIPGLHVEFLGPPRDESFISRMDPPADQHFLRLGAGGEAEAANPLEPFARERWAWSAGQYASFNSLLQIEPKQRQRLRESLGGAGAEYAAALASFLDKYRNNTSLVALLSFRGRNLLFPGDAQYGNWRWWLDNLGGEDLLHRVDFVKVAHHGSVNATPVDAVHGLTAHPAAMVSTQQVKSWPSLPDTKLLDAIEALSGGRLVRSDSLVLPEFPDAPQGPAIDPLPAGFTKGDFWYDYNLPLA